MNEEKAMFRLLLIEDEETLRISLADDLREIGYFVAEASNVDDALELWTNDSFDVVVTDMKLPGNKSGLDMLDIVKSTSSSTIVIVVTAYGTVQNAVDAMKGGANDYLTKPFSIEELTMVLDRALKFRQLEIENSALRERIEHQFHFSRIVGESAGLAQLKSTLQIISPTDETILIEGETGTGKELIAQTIHENSPRAKHPFIAISCASVPEGLLESELFGHERGAFTGAVQRKLGRFELAAGGTLMLDEVDDIPLSLQVKLLRVLQEHEFQRVGGSQTIKTQARVIATTKRDLVQLIEQGSFRSDLYYRLNVIPIYIPPLRYRKDDILPLIRHFCKKTSNDQSSLEFLPKAWNTIYSYSWPGNVRQLENLVKRLLVLSQGRSIDIDLLPREMSLTTGVSSHSATTEMQELNYKQILTDCEINLLQTALQRASGNKSLAAELLGLKPSTFRDRLGKFNIQ